MDQELEGVGSDSYRFMQSVIKDCQQKVCQQKAKMGRDYVRLSEREFVLFNGWKLSIESSFAHSDMRESWMVSTFTLFLKSFACAQWDCLLPHRSPVRKEAAFHPALLSFARRTARRTARQDISSCLAVLRATLESVGLLSFTIE